MTSANQSQINRLMKEIVNLQANDAQETKKEADLVAKINRANEVASRTRTVSTLERKLREAERASKDLASVRKKRADIAKKISDKSTKLNSYQRRQMQETERERKKQADLQKKQIREREQHERRITREIRSRANLQSMASASVHAIDSHADQYDFFISHASEDKDSFVRGLAEALQARGATVWYDEFTLKIGDSLRRKIDQGLRNSRYGVVVVSQYFFAKEWPQKELDGLFSMEADGSKRILPIWHEISMDEVIQYSPTLADKFALNTSLNSTEEIAEELIQKVNPPP